MSNQEKQQQCQKRRRYLLDITEVPSWLQYNRWIHTGYRRVNQTPLEALGSLFYFHNETINVWSHLVPSILCGLVLWWNLLPGQSDPVGWLIMFSFSFALGFSAAYHLFMPCCTTQQSYRDLLCVDVLGSLLAMVCSAYSFLLYGNRCFPESVGWYTVALLTCFSLFLVYAILFTTMSALQRVLLFATMISLRVVLGLWTVHFKIVELALWTGAKYHFAAFAALTGGAMFNVTRIPERFLSPPFEANAKRGEKHKHHHSITGARFTWITDYCFNSHNIWHFFCTLAILFTALGCHYDRVEYELQGTRCG